MSRGLHSRSRGLGALAGGSRSARILLAAIYACGVQTALGQEALRNSLAGEESAEFHRQQLENGTGNLQIGLANFLIGGSFGVEWNNNVAYSDADRQEDWILRPAASLAAWLPLTEKNAFSASVEIGYAKYLNYPQYDRLFVSPGTHIAFDAYVADFHFALHDDITVLEHPIAQGTISGAGDYGEFSNSAGLDVDWDLNKLIATLSYEHVNTIATKSSFSYLDHRADNLLVRAAFQPSDAWSFGPELTGGFTAYDKPVLNDSDNYSIGAFAAWTPATLSRVTLRAGYTSFLFQSLPYQPPVPDSRSYYLGVKLNHRLNENMSITVDAGRQLRLGINSDLLDLWYAYPRLDWRLLEKVPINIHLTFEDGTDNGTSVLVAKESYTLLGGGLGAAYQVMEKVLLQLNYDYAVKDSDVAGRDYHQHRILFDIQYTF